MRYAFLAPVLVLIFFLLTACTAPGAPQADSDGTSSEASDESLAGYPATAALAAREALAVRLSADAGEITVEDAEPRDWSDSCLGLGGPAESCAAVITPGYAFLLVHDGTDYHYRTNSDGTAVRGE